ncbi:3532_t:CDS:2, partial [Scutellospora calospora]
NDFLPDETSERNSNQQSHSSHRQYADFGISQRYSFDQQERATDYESYSGPQPIIPIITRTYSPTEQIQTEQMQTDIHIQNPLNEDMITTCFHVMIPKDLTKKSKVYVIGNIEKLGMSKKGVIQLRQSKRNLMYWFSDPVIPLSSFQKGPIEYKYYIYRGAEISIKSRIKRISGRSSQFEKEGIPETSSGNWQSEDTEHELISKENQYDLWKKNNIGTLRLKDFKENYPFLYIIYKSITPKNLKDKIIEYQDINKRHSDILDYNITSHFVFTYFNDYDSIVEQQIFLSVLLSYVMNERIEIRLQENFNSIKLLEAFNGINEEHLPHDVNKMLAQVVSALVRHASTYYKKFEWMKAFKIAPVADPNYTFLEHIEMPAYNKENVTKFQTSLYKIVKPCIDDVSGKNVATYMDICKALVKLCNDLSVILFLWQKIFDICVKIDDGFTQYFLKCMSNFIAKDNAKELINHLEEIPLDIEIDFAPMFRDRTLALLRNAGTTWNKYSIDAMFKLLHNVRLKWQNAYVIQALEYISISQNPELLKTFPNILDNFLKKGFMDEKVGKTCIQWLKYMLSYLKKVRNMYNFEENYAFLILYNLEIIYNMIDKYNITCNELFDIAEREIKDLSDDIIFDAATDAGKLKYTKVIEILNRILKEKFGPDVKNIDGQLQLKIMKICRSNARKLHIRNRQVKVFDLLYSLYIFIMVISNLLLLLNRLCEDIVCHIMTRLHENLPRTEININDASFLKALLASSKFWIFILSAVGSTERLHKQHVYVKTVFQAIINLVFNLRNMSIEIGMLKEILNYDDDQLLTFFAIVRNDNVLSMIDITVLQLLRENYKAYFDKLKNLEIFYNQFCTHTVDVQDYINDIKSKLNMQEKVILQDAFDEAFWTFHKPIIDIAQSVYIYIKSQTFKNVLERHSKARGVTLTVELVATKFMREALTKYNWLRAEYRNWMTLNYSITAPFWKDVKDIDYELELMSRDMNWYPRDDMKKAICYLPDVKLWRERIDDLEKTLRIFRVQNVVDSWVANVHNKLKDPLILISLFKAINEIDRCLTNFDASCWKIIRALSSAGDFLTWLYTVAEDDLRNLMNSVNDGSEDRE